MRKRKTRHHQSHGQAEDQRAREAQPAPNESDFCKFQWVGHAATEEFFKLHDEPAFGGTGDSGVVLPPHPLSVSRHPTVGAAVVNAYAHGLEFAEQVIGAGGVGLSSFLISGYVTALFYPLNELLYMGLLSWILFIGMLAGLFFFYRFDTVGYRYTPVMFNRALGKVHVFRDETKFFSLWPLWGGGKHRIDTYDWSCVRAQVTRSRTFTGSVAQDNAVLGCIVLQGPKTPNVVAEFPLGIVTSALAIQSHLDHWEHIRRFMEHEGPLFQEGEGPYEDWGTQSLMGAVFFGQPLLDLTDKDRANAGPLTTLWQVVAVFLFPLLATFGLLRWLSSHLRSKPKWPAEILASVGGAALHGGDLEAWRGVIPERPTPVEGLAVQALEEATPDDT